MDYLNPWNPESGMLNLAIQLGVPPFTSFAGISLSDSGDDSDDNTYVETERHPGDSEMKIGIPPSTASHLGHIEIVDLLLHQDTDVSQQGADCRPALHEAAKGDFLEIAELLWRYGADVNKRDVCGGSALYFAAKRGSTRIVKLLLESGADVRHRYLGDDTTLYQAARTRPAEIAELLLRYGADPNKSDKHGSVAPYNAADCGSSAIVQLMLIHGADFKKQDTRGELRCTMRQPMGLLKLYSSCWTAATMSTEGTTKELLSILLSVRSH
jgi:ankyrin repeat protein